MTPKAITATTSPISIRLPQKRHPRLGLVFGGCSAEKPEDGALCMFSIPLYLSILSNLRKMIVIFNLTLLAEKEPTDLAFYINLFFDYTTSVFYQCGSITNILAHCPTKSQRKIRVFAISIGCLVSI
jgi:hypothetical protein